MRYGDRIRGCVETPLIGPPDGNLEETSRQDAEYTEDGAGHVFYRRPADGREFKCLEFPTYNEWFDVSER